MRKVFVALAAAAAVAVFAPIVAADQPTKVEIVNVSFPGVLPAGAGCSFDIGLYTVINGTYKAFYDKNGLVTKEQYHLTEQDTFTYNNTLLGVPFTFNVTWLYDSAGNLTNILASGVAEKVRLPDGSLFISAGRIDFGAHGFPEFILIPDHGTTVNLEGFCAALEYARRRPQAAPEATARPSRPLEVPPAWRRHVRRACPVRPMRQTRHGAGGVLSPA